MSAGSSDVEKFLDPAVKPRDVGVIGEEMKCQQTRSAMFREGCQGMLVDEAHAFGLYGPEGLGRVAALGLTAQQVPLRIIPLGKAMGVQGAIVAGQSLWVQAFLQEARGGIYSTAMSPALAAGLMDVLALLRASEEARYNLERNSLYFKQLATQTPLRWRASDSAIHYLFLGCNVKALAVSEALAQQGIVCRAMRAPTVPTKEAGLRVVIRADHTFSQIERLIQSLTQVVAHESTVD